MFATAPYPFHMGLLLFFSLDVRNVFMERDPKIWPKQKRHKIRPPKCESVVCAWTLMKKRCVFFVKPCPCSQGMTIKMWLFFGRLTAPMAYSLKADLRHDAYAAAFRDPPQGERSQSIASRCIYREHGWTKNFRFGRSRFEELRSNVALALWANLVAQCSFGLEAERRP